MKKCTKKLLFSAMKKCEKAYNTLILTLGSMFMFSSPVYADQPKLVSGTVALFQAATTWLLVIIPVGAGFMLGYQALLKSMTDDHAVVAEKNKFMKNVLIGAIIAETASGLVVLVLSFYS